MMGMNGKDLTERTYRQMKRDLMLGRLDKDEVFNEQTFADRYGCSRTPVREAAGRLVAEGFLNKYPRKGYFIRVPSEYEVGELRECRYILECSVIDKIVAAVSDEKIHSLAALSSEREDDVLFTNNLAFHMAMAQLAGNTQRTEMIERLLCLLVRPMVTMRYRSYDDYAARVQERDGALTEEHEAILNALLARDGELAKKLLREDIYPAKY